MSETPIYDETLALHEMELDEPTWLERYPFVPCDGHAEPTIQAIVRHKGVELCGHCAFVALGVQHQNHDTWMKENRLKGSEN